MSHLSKAKEIEAKDPGSQPQLCGSRAMEGGAVAGEVSFRKAGLVLRKRKNIMKIQGHLGVSVG